jgi:hypothetical protein
LATETRAKAQEVVQTKGVERTEEEAEKGAGAGAEEAVGNT